MEPIFLPLGVQLELAICVRDFFQKYTDNYVLIGGTACSILFDEIGENFRATKDLDVVLIVENISEEFGQAFWEFIKEANYNGIETGETQRQFYRFRNPTDATYPKMIELFSRTPDIPLLPETHLTPVLIADDVSSLSAILLNDDYYRFLLQGRRIVDGLSVLDEKYLIPFKAKAWCELSARQKGGEEGNSRHIRKHYLPNGPYFGKNTEIAALLDVKSTRMRSFCNQKFYRGQLIVMTKDQNEPDVLAMYRTTAGSHARSHVNQRQIDVIR